MARVRTLDEWREAYKQGHLAFLMKYMKVFLRDYLVVAFIMVGLIKFHIMRPYSLSMMIFEAVAFVTLGAAFGELQWFLLKKKFGIPEDI